MTAVPPLAYPGTRVLAGWWRQLADHRPEALWVGHLLLHRVEALIEQTTMRRLDSVERLVLRALALTPGATTAELDRECCLGSQLLRRLLGHLATANLAREASGCWTLTDRGGQAIAQGEYAGVARQRREFYFAATAAGEPPLLPLRKPGSLPWPAEADWRFAAAELAAWPARHEEEKRRCGFPLDITRVVGLDAPADDVPAWQQVVLDRPERLPVAITRHGGALTVFAMRPEGWALSAEPVLELAESRSGIFPEIAAPPDADALRQAWLSWCQARGLAALGGEVGELRLEGHELHVAPTPRLQERLRLSRGDAGREEFWVLIGAGLLRQAAIVKVDDVR